MLKGLIYEGLYNNAWVLLKNDIYYVMKTGVTHSESVAAFEKTEDGFSIAKKYCDYLDKRTEENKIANKGLHL